MPFKRYMRNTGAPESIGSAAPVLAERLMYGSDWHMISQDSDWGDYARELHTSTKDFIKPENFFGGNAIACFGAATEASTSGEGAGAVLQ